MKYLYILIILTVSSCSVHHFEKIGVYKEVNPDIYLKYVSDSSVNIIDVRTASEYLKSHIEGAQNASYFSAKFNKIIDSLSFDHTKTTLIYCETQHRSLFVVKKLYKKGFKEIVDLDKGMMNWRKLGFPSQN